MLSFRNTVELAGLRSDFGAIQVEGRGAIWNLLQSFKTIR